MGVVHVGLSEAPDPDCFSDEGGLLGTSDSVTVGLAVLGFLQVGLTEGTSVGSMLGRLEGVSEGMSLGRLEGVLLGRSEAFTDGIAVSG